MLLALEQELRAGGAVSTVELIFAVDALADETVWRIYDEFDAVIATHGGVTLLEVTTEGRTPVLAAKDVVRRLEVLGGVRVQRCYEDLVSRADIAARTKATVQAVGQWIRGNRQKATPFPEAFNLVNGGVWLWGEVNQWLGRVGRTSDDCLYPSREDYIEINRWIVDRSMHRRISSISHEEVPWTRAAGITAASIRKDSAPLFSWPRADAGRSI